MELVHKHVIPKISEEWETVCDHLEYSLAIKNIISRTNNESSTECCTALLKDWVTSDNGVKPKTWEKLIEVLNEISSLAVVTKQIKQYLYKEGVIAGKTLKEYNYRHIVMDTLTLLCTVQGDSSPSL